MKVLFDRDLAFRRATLIIAGVLPARDARGSAGSLRTAGGKVAEGREAETASAGRQQVLVSSLEVL